MFSHITVGCKDIAKAAVFYEAILSPLDLIRREVLPDGGPQALCWIRRGHPLPRFYVYLPLDGKPAISGNGCMVAFMAPSPAAVDAAYAAGLMALGTDEGAPGLRPQYGDGYYGAYLRDPDGNKIHIVYRGDLSQGCNAHSTQTAVTAND